MVGTEANIIYGTSINEELDDEIIITVIATGIANDGMGIIDNNVQKYSNNEQKLKTAATMQREIETEKKEREYKFNINDDRPIEIPSFLQKHRRSR